MTNNEKGTINLPDSLRFITQPVKLSGTDRRIDISINETESRTQG